MKLIKGLWDEYCARDHDWLSSYAELKFRGWSTTFKGSSTRPMTAASTKAINTRNETSSYQIYVYCCSDISAKPLRKILFFFC